MSNRTKNSIRNTSVGFISQILVIVAAFVTRTIFIATLGKTYLGVSGLFSDILQLLSLAEMGVGTAILYEMYKPIARNDERKVSALMRFYGRIYTAIGILVIILGAGLIPFLYFFIDNKSHIPDLKIIYVLYLLNTAATYFFAYKRNILIATQNGHRNSINQMKYSLIQQAVQIVILFATENFLIYLSVQIICTIWSNIAISRYVDKNYEYLKYYKNEKLTKMELSNIFRNVRAMLTTKISSVVVTSTDNILISKFVSTIFLGLYSNYTLFVTMLRTIVTKLFEGLTGSVGNLATLEDHKKSHEVYTNLLFVNFWIVGYSVSMYCLLINDFILMWLGNSFLIGTSVVFMVSFNLFCRLIRNTTLIYIETYGLFNKMKVKSISEAILNLALSLFFLIVLKWGIFGVLLGTFASNLLTNFWWEPLVIYKYCFRKSVWSYFLKFLLYITMFLLGIEVNYFIYDIFDIGQGALFFILKMLIATIVINSLYFMIFCRSKEYKYFKVQLLKIFGKLKGGNT